MKRYYIPTTSLNFNNILSTESISPKAFYSQRGFGYSRWFTIPENEMDGAILLYESPAMINRPASDIEDHPLMIEINTDEEYPLLVPGVRYSQHTIYFNPWFTNFYFQTERDKTIALSMSDSSLETKLIRLYFKKITVQTFSGNFPNLDKSISIPVDNQSIEEDIRINKLKGLLYGYYIGANLSSSIDDVRRLNTLREIQNIFAAAISSHERTPNDAQMLRLSELFGLLSQYEPLYKDLLQELGTPQLVNRVVTILRKHGIESLCLDWRRIVADLQFDSNGQNTAVTWIMRELEQHQKKMISNIKLLSALEEQIITDGKQVTKISCDALSTEMEIKLYLFWINNLLINKKYTGKVSSMKAELADDLTQAAINCMGEEWKDSEIRTYLNQLRKHVRGGEFTQPWMNGLLPSLTAVITKGDDWEQLWHFLQSKILTDYRLAFSFYGILNGYANLTRDFTDVLYNNEREYVAEVYKEIYGQLHGITISPVPSENILNSAPIAHVGFQIKNKTSLTNQTEETLKTRHSLTDDIWDFYQSSAFKGCKKKTELEKGLRICIDKLGDNFTPQAFVSELCTLEDYGWNKNNKAWKQMQLRFCPELKVSSSRKKYNKKVEETPSPSLFDSFKEGVKDFVHSMGISSDAESTNEEHSSHKGDFNKVIKSRKDSSVLEDSRWIRECETFIDDSEAKKQFLTDIEWFIGNHHEVYHDKKKGDLPGVYKDRDKSNGETIIRLQKYLEKKLVPNEKCPWLSERYKKIPIERITMYLEKLYGNR